MLLTDGGVPPTDTPPWDTFGQSTLPPLDHGGFDFGAIQESFAASHNILGLSVILLLLVLLAAVVYTCWRLDFRAAFHVRKVWAITACAALAIGLAGAGWGVVDAMTNGDSQSSSASHKKFASWASHRYDIKISQAGFDELLSGQPVAVTQFDSRVVVRALHDQDGLTYLFDSYGHELVNPSHAASGDPVGAPPAPVQMGVPEGIPDISDPPVDDTPVP